jgi:HD-like signal output (HDOD) protein
MAEMVGTGSFLGLIIRQNKKPQQTLVSYLRMILNFRYGVDVIMAGGISEGCAIIQRNPEGIICAFVVQDEVVDSKTAISTLSKRGEIPLLLLLPKRCVESLKALRGPLPNISIGTWERAFDGTSASIKSLLEKSFARNKIDLLIGCDGGISHRELQGKIGRRIKNLQTLPTLPQVVLNIMRMMNDPRATIDDLEKLISSDPSIVWKLLEVIKGPVFAGTRRSGWTLREIIVRLGMRKVGAIAQQIKLVNSFVKVDQRQFDLRRFWKHSIGCAMVADRLYAKRMISIEEKVEFDEYWVGALLHDIGKLVLGVYFPAYFQKVLDEMQSGRRVVRDFHAAENELGFPGLHEDVTKLMLLKAHLEPKLVEEIGAQHMRAQTFGGLASLLHMADNICKDLKLGYLENEQGKFSKKVLRELGLRLEDVKQIENALGDAMAEEIEDVVQRSIEQKKKIDVPADSVEESGVAAAEEGGGVEARAREGEVARLAQKLKELQDRLRGHPDLSPEQREDFLVDADNLRAQIDKNVPNETVVLALLDQLAAAEFCGDLIAAIQTLLAVRFQYQGDIPTSPPTDADPAN